MIGSLWRDGRLPQHDAGLPTSWTDVLTGLTNRRYILEILDGHLRRYKHGRSSLCVALIDIDWFKSIHDHHGHEVGDAVLQHYSSVCRERLSPEIAVGRPCGEEFLLLLPFVSLKVTVQTMDQFRADLPPARIGECVADLAYTFSAGLTEILPQDDRNSLLQSADQTLYAAKADLQLHQSQVDETATMLLSRQLEPPCRRC